MCPSIALTPVPFGVAIIRPTELPCGIPAPTTGTRMRIEPYKRVVYKHNPLAEVICQIRFAKVASLSAEEEAGLSTELAAMGYAVPSNEIFLAAPKIVVAPGGDPQADVVLQQTKVRHFSSSDGAWRVSVSSEFVALTCLKYESWGTFLPRLLSAERLLNNMRPDALPTRIGLRYKDLVEREPLSLGQTPWHELISSFLLGPLMPDALAVGQTVTGNEVGSLLAQALLRVDDCMLLLQSSLLRSNDDSREAFLIDSDFFHEGGLSSDLLSDESALRTKLDGLHAHAGALFRRCITERLHDALRPGA